MLDFASWQAPSFKDRGIFWLNLVGERGTSARFVNCYRNYGSDQPGHFKLSETGIMCALEDRLVIEWGPGTRHWHEWGTNEKPVITILERQRRRFTGFEDLVLTFEELDEIASDPTRYPDWHAALSSVNAIYLITDRKDGRHYVGSAYGKGSLLGRWSAYLAPHHGGNKKLVASLDVDPSRYAEFQFSVLQILPKTATEKDVGAAEALYKRKLLSREFGLNAN